MKQTLTEIWKGIAPLVFIGWGVAALRLVLEFVAPGISMWIGVYYTMPIVIAIFAFTGNRFDGWAWKRFALAGIILAFMVWFIPNAIAYSLAQFQGWDHGRFSAERSAPLADNSMSKLITGIGVGGMTFVAGSVWSILFFTLLGWLPKKLKSRKDFTQN